MKRAHEIGIKVLRIGRVVVSRRWRQVVLAGLDLIAVMAAVVGAFLIRFDGTLPPDYTTVLAQALLISIPGRILIYYFLGFYSQVWTHASIPELLRIVWGVALDTAVSAIIVRVLLHDGFPASVFILASMLTVAALGSIRLALRLRHDWLKTRHAPPVKGERTLIFGAGDAGTMLARELVRHPELGLAVIGFIDDDPHKQGYRLVGKPVLGTRDHLESAVRQHGISHLIIASPSAPSKVIREVLKAGRDAGLNLKTIPGLFELVHGNASITQIRDVQIEDLLGRKEIKVDLAGIAAYLKEETVLITGAGGSIGSELCRQVARIGPRALILLGHGENSIYDISMEMRRHHPLLDITPVIADIQDQARIRRVFEEHRPGVVFHAAAHKHVPLMENNAGEAIKNNVFGTLNLARAAQAYRTKRFVLISTDKAVNPTSVMGATKRVAEHIIQCHAQQSDTVFVAVRFGNVLGSRGSVIPLFKQQIAEGGPVTVTDPRMLRYFMTIPEAVQLGIEAAAMGTGGEVFVLDMGKPVRIGDLARDLIRLSGFEPDVDIPIVYTGMRPGEKLFEELLTAEEGTAATQHNRILRARGEAIAESVLELCLERLGEMAERSNVRNEELLALVTGIVAWDDRRQAAGAAQ